jgi:hypothetical protein
MQTAAEEVARVAARVAVAADVGELRAAGGFERASALDRGRVEQQQAVARAGAAAGKDTDEPLDRLSQPAATLVQRVLAGQVGKQVTELAARGLQETPVTRLAHQHLRHRERDDLGVGQPTASVSWRLRQQVVSRAVDTDQEQVEVGVHRGLQADDVGDTADFDLPLLVPTATARAVASII